MKKLLTLTMLFMLTVVGAKADSWIVAGDSGLMGVNWSSTETSNEMTNVDGTTIWTLTKSVTITEAKGYNYKVVKYDDWHTAYPSENQNIYFEVPGTYNVKFIFDTSDNSVKDITVDNLYFFGGSESGNWSLQAMELQSDGKTFKYTIDNQNGTDGYVFVLVRSSDNNNGTAVDGSWGRDLKPNADGTYWRIKMQNLSSTASAYNNDSRWWVAPGIKTEFYFNTDTYSWNNISYMEKSIVANDRNIATFGLPKTYGKVQVPSGVAVYKAASNDETTIQLKKVAEDTGIISLSESASVGFAIVGTPGTYRFEATDGDAVSLDGNLFVGTGTDANAQAPAGSYVLGNTTANGLAFYHTDAAKTLGALKAYIEGGSSAKTVLFWDETNGIANLSSEKTDNVYYDLQGRRVMNPTKGLFIVNGKKVIR